MWFVGRGALLHKSAQRLLGVEDRQIKTIFGHRRCVVGCVVGWWLVALGAKFEN